MNRQQDFSANTDVRILEHVEGVGDSSLRGVLDGNDAIAHILLFNAVKDPGDRLCGLAEALFAKGVERSLVGKRTCGAEIGDGDRRVSGELIEHDLAPDPVDQRRRQVRLGGGHSICGSAHSCGQVVCNWRGGVAS